VLLRNCTSLAGTAAQLREPSRFLCCLVHESAHFLLGYRVAFIVFVLPTSFDTDYPGYTLQLQLLSYVLAVLEQVSLDNKLGLLCLILYPQEQIAVPILHEIAPEVLNGPPRFLTDMIVRAIVEEVTGAKLVKGPPRFVEDMQVVGRYVFG